LFAEATTDDRAHLVETLEGVRQSSRRCRFDRTAIPLDAGAFAVVASEAGALSANLVQLHRLNAGMTLNGEQSIRCFHRTVLPRVTRKNDPGISFLGESEQRQHLLSTNLASFINDDDGSLR